MSSTVSIADDRDHMAELIDLMDRVGEEATAQGLTDEKLAELLEHD
jgi:hypothetical protein